ncbi:hypothetical protein AAG906_026392 [Vitis piasezkii]
MTTTPILAMPNFNEPFTVETSASREGIDAVLTQQGRPIAFMSQALGVAKRSWSTYAKEMLAILQAQCIGTPKQKNWVLGSPILDALFVLHVELWEDIKSTAKDHPYMDRLCQLAHNNPGQPCS